MENVTNDSQPAEYLEMLLDYLACPIDNTIPLSAVRDASGKVTALKSRNAEYPIIHNVPCLIPKLEDSTKGNLPRWKRSQKKMWQEYQEGDKGIFTAEDNKMARRYGEIIAQSGGGLYLDVGCGALSWPMYMASSSDCVRWIGVDPFFGDAVRRFPFVQGLGEYLPFLPEVFDGAFYASTIYYLLDPQRSLKRVHSILKPLGKLFVFFHASRVGRRYLIWRVLRVLGFSQMFSEYCQWAFTPRSLRAQVERAGFSVENIVFLCEECSDFSTCKSRNEYLVIARRT